MAVRLGVFDPNRPKDKLLLRLFSEGEFVRLVAVDEVGNPLEAGVLLTINSDGKIFRAKGIAVKGVTVDGEGRIALAEENEIIQ